MLLSLACFLQWGPVGLSLEESSQMMVLEKGLISGCFMSNSFLGIICTGFFLIGRLTTLIQ